MTGFIDGPVYPDPATTKATVTTESINILTIELPGPLIMIHKTAMVMRKVNAPSATAPVCRSTFTDGPISVCLYCDGMSSTIASAPPTAPAAYLRKKIKNQIFTTRNENRGRKKRDLGGEAERHGEERVAAESNDIEGGVSRRVEAGAAQDLRDDVEDEDGDGDEDGGDAEAGGGALKLKSRGDDGREGAEGGDADHPYEGDECVADGGLYCSHSVSEKPLRDGGGIAEVMEMAMNEMQLWSSADEDEEGKKNRAKLGLRGSPNL